LINEPKCKTEIEGLRKRLYKMMAETDDPIIMQFVNEVINN